MYWINEETNEIMIAQGNPYMEKQLKELGFRHTKYPTFEAISDYVKKKESKSTSKIFDDN